MTDGSATPMWQDVWVGGWHVAGDLNRIARDGQVIRLEPKAMAVLLYLAQRPLEVVGRDELLGAVWPGVVVGDNALTQVVIKLRRALGDTAREPRYVQAIAKKGYRLMADVRRTGQAQDDAMPLAMASVPSVVSVSVPVPPAVSEPVPGPGALTGSPPSARRWSKRLVVAMSGVVLMLAGVVWMGRSSWPPQAQAQAQAQAPVGVPLRATTPVVLVEPFETLSPDASQALTARAITADLLTDLSKVSGLWVVGGTRAAALAAAKSAEQPRYLLSGTVQQEGDRLRLNVRLSDAQTGRQLWSERIDRHARDLFDVQDALVARVLAVLPVKITEAETLRIAQRSTRNLQAYHRFVLAQADLLVRTAAQNDAARALYWEAIGLDPAFARAYAGLALTYAMAHQQGWGRQGEHPLDRASGFARTAIQMRPDMPEAHWVLAFVSAQRRQHADALHHLDDALRLNPSYADAHALKGGIDTYIGQPALGIEQLQTALRLNPGAGSLYFLLLGRAYYFLGDDEQARANLERTLERNPENLEARIYLAATQSHSGNHDASRWQVSEIRNLDPAFAAAAWLANYPLTDAAERGRLLSALTDLGL